MASLFFCSLFPVEESPLSKEQWGKKKYVLSLIIYWRELWYNCRRKGLFPWGLSGSGKCLLAKNFKLLQHSLSSYLTCIASQSQLAPTSHPTFSEINACVGVCDGLPAFQCQGWHARKKRAAQVSKEKAYGGWIILKSELALKATRGIGILTTGKSSDKHLIKMER